MKSNKYITIIGYILGFISFYYIYLVIKRTDLNWASIQDTVNSFDYFLMLFSLACYILVMLIGSILWSLFVKIFSAETGLIDSQLILVHAKSNLGKYLPGNILHLIGRNVLGTQLGYKNSKLIFASVFEMLYLIIIGFFMVFSMELFGLSQIQFDVLIKKSDYSHLLIIAITVTIAILLFVFRQRISLFLANHDLKSHFFKTWIYGVSGYTLAYLLLGLSNLLIFAILTENLFIYNDYKNLLLIYLISWLMGFIIPGPPGGLGVREAIYILLASTYYDLVLVTTLALIIRVMNIIGDIVYFIICMVMCNNYKKGKHDENYTD